VRLTEAGLWGACCGWLSLPWFAVVLVFVRKFTTRWPRSACVLRDDEECFVWNWSPSTKGADLHPRRLAALALS
jgi:hypothetical protein